MSKRKNNKKQNIWQIIASIAILTCIMISGYMNQNEGTTNPNNSTESTNQAKTFDISTIPEYTSSPYIEINNNIPYFTDKDYNTNSFERYSEWDDLGRSGVAFANICKETMPRDGEERGDISSVRNLSGWVQKRYDNLIKDKYLYNRCHLIGWQLSAENANKQNLITGTRYLNTEGMLPFENKVAEYMDKHGKNHVLYRVTPIYEDENLLASGVEMEAWSVEDSGKGVCFNVYCYNVQPGIVIDYLTGESHAQK